MMPIVVRLRSKIRYNEPGLRIYDHYLQQSSDKQKICLQNSTFFLSLDHSFSTSVRPRPGKFFFSVDEGPVPTNSLVHTFPFFLSSYIKLT